MPAVPSSSARWALWGGVAFAAVFTGVVALLGPRLASVPHLPDAGASWYFWQLPHPTLLTRAAAWGGYLLHQVVLWGLIAWAQRARLKTTGSLHRVNVLALAANALFAGLHLLQTHLTYDGLAQDVSIWSSFGSVAFLLIWVLLMENPRRGLLLGWKAPIGPRVNAFARRYHGYVFSWAVVYTFWYHPMEATTGHLWGFFYTLLLMVQGSLFFTRVHLNRWWTLALEVMVLGHGTVVALQGGQRFWPMFFFGFGGIFVLTQMHGLGWSRWIRGVVLGAYALGAAVIYARPEHGFARLNEIIRIPVIDYLGVALLALLLGGIVRVGRWSPGARAEAATPDR